VWLFIAIAVVAGYLLGNLNGAVLASKALGDDVRTHGSGNAGLTNFIRSYGAGRAALVIVIDAGKAVVGCGLGGILLHPYFRGAKPISSRKKPRVSAQRPCAS